MFLLDTNVVLEAMRRRPDDRVAAWLDTRVEADLFLSVVTVAEIERGIALFSEGRRRNELGGWLIGSLIPRFGERILPVDVLAARRGGGLMAHLSEAGRTLAPFDALIAGTALVHGLILVTRNTRDFEAIEMAVLNPWEPA